MPAVLQFKGALYLTGTVIGDKGPMPLDLTVSAARSFAYESEIATGVTDQSLVPITGSGSGLTTVTTVIIIPEGNISAKVGAAASNVAFVLNGADSGLILFDTSLTAISLSNASGATVRYKVILLGS